MGFGLRTIAGSIRFPEAASLNTLEQAIPQATVEAVVTDLGVKEQRMRKLPAMVTLLLCVAMGAGRYCRIRYGIHARTT